MTTAAKIAAFLVAAFILTHWLTAGHDDIVEGPNKYKEYSDVRP